MFILTKILTELKEIKAYLKVIAEQPEITVTQTIPFIAPTKRKPVSYNDDAVAERQIDSASKVTPPANIDEED